MRHYKLYIILLFTINFSCNDKSNETNSTNTEVTEDNKVITEKDIEAIRYTDYGLSSDSKNALANWLKYQELTEQTAYLKKGDLSFFNGDKELLKTFLNDFKTEIPASVNTDPVLSRISVLETKLLKLNSTFRLDNINKSIHLTNIKEYLIAFSNLNLQINKKFEIEANNVDKNF